MFKIGQTVLYGTNGVCHISDIRDENFSGESKTYYVLTPFSNQNSTIYVSVNNSKNVSMIKNVLTKEEVYHLIQLIPECEIYIEKDNKLRKDLFSKILKSGDRLEMIRLLKTIYIEKIDRQKSGKKLWISDETAYKTAEKILYEEFSAVLNISYEEISALIQQQLESIS